MTKKLLLLATAALFNIIGIQAQTDVTSQYIINPGFEDCEAVEITECHGYGSTVLGNGYSLMISQTIEAGYDYAEQGWQLVSQNTNANGGVVGYGGKVQYSKSGFEDLPANGPTTSSGSKAFCFCGNNALVYKQPESVTLPAGSYKMTVYIYPYNGAYSSAQPTTRVKDFTGFIDNEGNEYFSPNRTGTNKEEITLNSNAWNEEIIEFELTQETTGHFQVSYGIQYFLVVDDIKLEYQGGVVTTSLSNVVAKAENLNAELNSNDLAEAISNAQDFIANPTTQEDVATQVEALYTAMATALAATTEPVNITAAYLENPSFETGIAPWTWVSATGNVGEPINTESTPFIDGKNILEFTSSGTNGISQTISHLPAGYYIIDAKLNQKAFLKIGPGSGTLIQGGMDALFLRVHPSAYNLTADGELTVGAQASVAYRVDNFRLFYGKDEASLLNVLLQDVKADAQAIVAMPKFDIVTGEERTNLLAAIDGTDIDAINTAANAFVTATDSYNNFEKAKTAAAAYNQEAYPYAKEEIFQQIQTLMATSPTSAANAQEMATQLNEACFNYYVSNAYCEGVANAVDYTEKIAAANATGTNVATAWHKLNMGIRTDKTAWVNPKTSESDKNVYGVTSDYYSTSNGKNSYLWQTISGLPKGKYVLSVTYMSATSVSPEVTVNDEKIGNLTGVGMYGGGMYGGGWVDNVITFDKADDGDMKLQLQYTGTANYQEWYFDNLRLFRIDAEQPQDEPEYGIVGDFSDWDTDLMMSMTEDGTYTLTIEDLEIKELKTFEYKLRADRQWGIYELPSPYDEIQNYSWTPEKSGVYTLNFVFNREENSLTLTPERTDDCTWTATYVNVEDWQEVWAYTWTDADQQMGSWPGTQLQATAEQVDGHDVYAFSYKGEAAPAFIIFNDGKSHNAKQTEDLTFEDGKQYNDPSKYIEPTGINSLSCPLSDMLTIYDLQGRRVAQPTKGLYIVNGKKTVIR